MKIVEKGTEDFRETRQRYFDLFLKSEKEDLIEAGHFTEIGTGKQKFLGFKSKLILQANLPMPFGCPSLFIQPTEGGGVIWFCGRVGCICTPCREDFTGEKEKYPDYCPPEEGFEPEYCDCGSSTCDICNPGWEYEEDYEEWEEDDYAY